ncbi:ParB family chromosome partitioning protein [Duganella sp. SG902]|uniref:ParB/RepB/Spo0J family partition protein n=1 Tax=Duganella sp. SG902 TaxID=2587016 RepID=UPI00159E602B|nr:hypothetical protein [Duganella sp. SG902]NVM77473.1 ParB family chromosome partitioning protein [Duganella sp. SG902]
MTTFEQQVAGGDHGIAGAASAVQQRARVILAHATIGTAAHAQFVRSPRNVRRKPADRSELKALVRSQGQLQNLICHEEIIDGVATGKLVVDAGDGRWQVIGELIAEGALPVDFQILYLLVSEAEAVVVGLAENLGRAQLHPADLCEGMLELAHAGRGVADIALIFGVPELTVRQRLKLAHVAPALFALYRDDRITYEQLAALAVSDDHAAQQAAWDGLSPWERQPARLRRLLTAHALPLRDDPVMRYVGLKAYRAAGGLLTHDLLSEDGDGYIDNPALLDSLAQAKLEKLAKRLGREGWHWSAAQPRADAAMLAAYGRVRKQRLAPTPEQLAQLQQLAQRAAALERRADGEGDEDGAIARQLADIDIAQGRIRMALERPDPDDMALAGVLLTVGEDGKACLLRGLIRPQDKARLRKEEKAAAKPRGPHSERLTHVLRAQRTLALRAELLAKPEVALLVLAHRLISAVFLDTHAAGGAVQLEVRAPSLPEAAQSGPAWDRWQAQREALLAALPQGGAVALMAWLQRQPRAVIDDYLAFCLSCGVNGLRDGGHGADGGDGEAGDEVAALARVVGLDMHAWWQPTARNYFSHVSKGRMMEVVAQATSAAQAAPLEAMRKEAAAEAAERAVAGTGWLPEVLAGAAG